MSSWYDAWADRYRDWTESVIADVPFYVGLAREADGPLVELAVGDGRVAIPVAQATGRRVIGIDASPAMLAHAQVRAFEEGVELDLREEDMREFTVDEPAGLIYSPGRSLLHLPTWADRRRCFERVAAALQPGGRFAWNAFTFDHHVASAIDGQHGETPLPHSTYYSIGENRVDIALDDGGTGSLWWATKNEWLGLLDVSGLQLEALYGGFAGEPLDDSSTEYVFVARR
jgi:ubiquinone/menaquinone biosynthesis C-methylase UbiE